MLWIAMDHNDGVSIREILSSGLPEPCIRYVCTAVAAALECIHGWDVIHREEAPLDMLPQQLPWQGKPLPLVHLSSATPHPGHPRPPSPPPLSEILRLWLRTGYVKSANFLLDRSGAVGGKAQLSEAAAG